MLIRPTLMLQDFLNFVPRHSNLNFPLLPLMLVFVLTLLLPIFPTLGSGNLQISTSDYLLTIIKSTYLKKSGHPVK